MKVLVDATMLDGLPSGAATRLAGLGAAHAARGRADVLHLVRPGTDPLPGLRCTPFAGMTTPWTRGLAGRRLARVAARERADLVAVAALPVPACRGVPVVLTLHDARFLDPHAATSRARRLWARHRLAANLARARQLVAVSRSTADALAARGVCPRERIAVVPNAPSPELHPIEDPDALAALRRRIDLNARYLLAIGPVAPHKRPERLVELLAALHRLEGCGDVGLVFAGRASPAASGPVLRRADALGLTRHVRLLGAVDAPTLSAALSGADALVVASRVEGFCIPVLDAQRFGVPVVAVRAGALPETCGDAGWLADDEAGALAAAARAAITPGPERAARVARAKELATRWSWSASAERLEALWERVAGVPDPGPRAG